MLDAEIETHLLAVWKQKFRNRPLEKNVRKRIRQNQNAFDKIRSTLKGRLKSLARQVTVPESPFDPSGVVSVLEERRLRSMHDVQMLLGYMDKIAEQAISDRGSLFGRLNGISDDYVSERKEWIKKLFALAEQFGLLDDLEREQEKE